VVIPRAGAEGRGVDRTADTPMDTVTFSTVEGELSYYLEANVRIVDVDGRELERFVSSSRQTGPFQRGEFDGDPARLPLRVNEEPFFDPDVIGQQVGALEEALMEDLAVAIAAGTYDTVLSGID
jgi:hypothetical protein